MLVTPNVALFAFSVVLIISAIASWIYRDYAQYDKCWFHTFIATLAGLGVFVTFMFYYNVVCLQVQQQNIDALQTLNNINSTLLNSILKETNKVAFIIPNFVLSINPLNSMIYDIEFNSEPDPINAQTSSAKITLSYRIFSLWQDVLSDRQILEKSSTSYITNFLQRANSQQLYQQWIIGKLNFSPQTQTFGDLLFKYGLPITKQTPESYILATNGLIADPIYQQLIKS